MQHLKFSIIIITWNAIHHLKKFLPDVAQTDYSNYEIIIADNNSDDETINWVTNNFPNIKIAPLDSNYGYAGGNNRAADFADGDILLFLNNDVSVEPDWLHPLNDIFQSGQADIVQPKIRSYNNPDYFEYAGASGGFIDKMAYPFCRGRLFDTLEKDMGQYNDISPIFWASGAAFAIRKEAFQQLGGFDEKFEFHMEEIDLCWRAHRSGHSIFVQPKSVVYHLGGGSLHQSNPRKTFYNYRNSLLMMVKNVEKNLFFTIFFRLCLDGISGIKSLLEGKPKETIAIAKAHFSFYALLDYALKQRKTNEDSKPELTYKKLIYPRLIILDYFLKKKKTFSELLFNSNDQK